MDEVANLPRQGPPPVRDPIQDLLALANVILMQLDAGHRVVWINAGAESVTGYAPEDLLGRNPFEVLTPRARYKDVWGPSRAAWPRSSKVRS